MATHFDLLIRGGTCMLPWGPENTDIGVRDGRIAAIGPAGAATADAVIEAKGLHVLPGLIDPHVHLRDPGDASIESIPTGTKAAVLGGLTAVFDMPNTAPSIVNAETLAWKQAYAARAAWCDMGIYVGGTKTNIADLASLETAAGVASPITRKMNIACRRASRTTNPATRIISTWNGGMRNAPFSARAA